VMEVQQKHFDTITEDEVGFTALTISCIRRYYTAKMPKKTH
jgi:hypothetical protein